MDKLISLLTPSADAGGTPVAFKPDAGTMVGGIIEITPSVESSTGILATTDKTVASTGVITATTTTPTSDVKPVMTTDTPKIEPGGTTATIATTTATGTKSTPVAAPVSRESALRSVAIAALILCALYFAYKLFMPLGA